MINSGARQQSTFNCVKKSGAATLIRNQLRRKNMDAAHREELTMQLTLLDTAITELKNQVKAKKENVKKC